MKVNRRYLGLRILTAPLKLVFTLIWFMLYSLIHVYQWVIFGSDEVVFGNDFNRNTIKELIQEIEKSTKMNCSEIPKS